MRLLIVHGTKNVISEMAVDFESQGYITDEAISSTTAEYFIKNTPPDLCLINGHMTECTAEALLRRWRKNGIKIPVIVFHENGKAEDTISALESGADDCVNSSYNIEEISARINAVIRRCHGYASPTISCYPYELDTQSKSLRIKGVIVSLTLFEYAILECLMLNADSIISRKKLMGALYGDTYKKDGRIISVIICRLRKKLGNEGGPHRIITAKKTGYIFISKSRS